MANYFLNNAFPSKRAMALEVGIPYRALLRLYTGKYTDNDVKTVMIGIGRYCLSKQIEPYNLFRGFSTI